MRNVLLCGCLASGFVLALAGCDGQLTEKPIVGGANSDAGSSGSASGTSTGGSTTGTSTGGATTGTSTGTTTGTSTGGTTTGTSTGGTTTGSSSGGAITGTSSGSTAGTATGSSGSSEAGVDDYLSGVYSGYFESFTFPDGSDTITLNLTFATDGTVTGTASFGSAPMFAPPTDPSVTYPPGFAESSLTLGPGAEAFGPQDLEGFTFTVLAGTFTSPRLQLQIQPNELWKQWCELQTTIYPWYNNENMTGGHSDGSIEPVSDGASEGCTGDISSYECMPNGGTEWGSGGCQVNPTCPSTQPIPFDCGKMTLCQIGISPCSCTSTSCTVQVGPTGSIAFDTQVDTVGRVDGSVTGVATGQILNVHLTRMQ